MRLWNNASTIPHSKLVSYVSYYSKTTHTHTPHQGGWVICAPHAPIGREGEGQGFETETQEVLNTYRKEGKGGGIRNRDLGGPERTHHVNDDIILP